MSDRHRVAILHIDDNETNRYVVGRTLRRAGFEFQEAATGKAGLRLMAEQQPDLVILDVRLPDIDGFEVCRQIKANPSTASIPVLHLSASFVKSEDKVQGLDGGADGYLAQPVEPIELLATIKALLRTRQAEETAIALAQQWQTTFDAMSDGVCLLDAQGKVLRSNKAFHVFALPEAIERSAFIGAQTTKHRESNEVQHGTRWFSTTVDPIVSDNGAFIGAVYILSDISDRKRAEEERAQLLMREQEARAAAEAANRMKDEFLATMSHELRTPLNVMLGWLQLLNTRKFDEAATAKAMEIIERSARAQAQLVEDLLDVSRIIQGKLRLNVRSIELLPVIKAALESVGPAAEAKEIELLSILDPAANWVTGDSDRLQQVIWNLLSNAIKFTPKGGQVRVRLERANAYIDIAVSDTGVGISPDFVPYVFERFRQADSSMTRSYSGLGLGLAIVRHLVELHGGTVRAESAGQGQGATFIVRLPLLPIRIEPSEEKWVNPAVSRGVPFDNPPVLNGLKVLIVDDETDTRVFLATVLQECGAEVIAVASASEAMEAILRFKPDVLVSDIGMPEEDGYSLIRKVRALPQEQGGAIPAAALTAYARAEDRTRSLMSGFQIHLPKPVEPAELAAVVANLSGRTERSPLEHHKQQSSV